MMRCRSSEMRCWVCACRRSTRWRARPAVTCWRDDTQTRLYRAVFVFVDGDQLHRSAGALDGGEAGGGRVPFIAGAAWLFVLVLSVGVPAGQHTDGYGGGPVWRSPHRRRRYRDLVGGD